MTATLLAAGVGFVGGLLSAVVPLWLRPRRRRRSLRQALRRELEVPAQVIEELNEQQPDRSDGPFHTEIPTTVYESLGSNLGLLSDEELDSVIAYYSTARVATEQLASADDDRVAERFFAETAPILKRTREEAVSAIEDRL